MRSKQLVLVGLLAVAGLLLLSGRTLSAEGEVSVGVDADPSGNTATSLGATDVCVSVGAGVEFDVDLWVRNTPQMIGWQSYLDYDPSVLQVTGASVDFMMLTDPDTGIFAYTELLPDVDGRFLTAAADLTATGYAGDGVLARVTLQAIGAGASPLSMSGVILVDSVGTVIGDVTGDGIFDGPSTGGIVWVDQSCPSGPGDADADGVADDIDNCLSVGNPVQGDRDGDGIGDWCDDGDSDGHLDTVDNCPNTFSWSLLDADGDGLGDACDDDIDGDGVPNTSDNAPNIPNADQADSDGDGTPDVLDLDVDGDGIPDKTVVTSITVDIGGDAETEVVKKTKAIPFSGLWEGNLDGDTDMDEVQVHVTVLTGSMQAVDLDGDGELEVVIKDPGQAPGLQQSYDLRSQDPDTDIDIVVLGGGEFGLLAPDPQDVDGDGEMESVVWEPEVQPTNPTDADLDLDSDVDVRWLNGQVSGMDNCPLVSNGTQANNDGDAYGDVCDDDDDNDGYSDIVEAYLGTNGLVPCGAQNWPADLASGGIPDSTNRINVMDLTSFLAPVRYLDTDLGANPGDVRWDLVPGAGPFLFDINIQDLVSIIALSPPMLGGAQAMNGPDCPSPP